MSFEAAASGLASTAFAVFGEPATFTPRIGPAAPVTVVLDHDVEVIGRQPPYATSRQVVASVLLAEVPVAKRGDRLVMASGAVWVVEYLESRDADVARHVVQEGSP